MLEANVHELMLLYRCSSVRNDFISYTSFFPANKGSSLINRKQAAQQAMTKAKAKMLEGSLVRQPTLDLRWTDQTGSRIFITQKWEPLVNTSNREN